MAIFVLKPWVSPFRKMAIFQLFELFFLYSLARRFFEIFSRIQYRTFSWPMLPKKEKLKKWPVLDQNHGLTPLEKCQFFDFLFFLFLQPRKAFLFVLEYLKIHFPGLLCLKQRSWKNGHFCTKTMEKWQFFDFFNFFFYSLKRRFLVLEYRKTHFPGLFCLKKRSCQKVHFCPKTMD